MLVYLYDGSFEGLLTCVYEGYYKEEPDEIIDTYLYKKTLFDNTKFIDTDVIKANKVGAAIIEKISEEFFSKILNAFFSENYNAGTYIFKLLKLAFKKGSDIMLSATNEIVTNVTDLHLSVARETHLLVGLVRFSELKNNIYYCEFSPTYNQLALLAEHFKNRLSDQLWVIHDIKRNLALFYNKESWYINEFYGVENYELSDNELLYRSLWKEFHKKVAITERINPKLQRSFMPKKYWKYLIEMSV